MVDRPSNPYVGPAPFTKTDAERFFGRETETEDLFALLIANRTVLLYSQSGAGKTSLVNAGILPLAEREGFDVLPSARVQGVLPEGTPLAELSNPYVFFTLVSWRGPGTESTIDPHGSMETALAALPRSNDRFGDPAPRLLIFDQFEEIFTSFPEQWAKRRDFFDQLAAALRSDPDLRALFIIREDYLADLLAMTDLMPDRVRSRLRLARLGRDAASAAIQGPVEATHRTFAPGVVQEMVDELLKSRVETRPGVTTDIVGEFVEPVQLQVVCSGLWDSLPDDTAIITAEHAERFGDVTNALIQFYEHALDEAAAASGVWTRLLRDWCSFALITPAGTRAMVYRGVQFTEGAPNAAVDSLENLHIIRAENRAGARWYELTHDRFIGPIQQSNRTKWERERTRLLIELAVAVVAAVAAFEAQVLIPADTSAAWPTARTALLDTAGIFIIRDLAGLVSRAPSTTLARARTLARSRSKIRIGFGVAGLVVLLASAIGAGSVGVYRTIREPISFSAFDANDGSSSYFPIVYSCGRTTLGVSILGSSPRNFSFDGDFPLPGPHARLRSDYAKRTRESCNRTGAFEPVGNLFLMAAPIALLLAASERRRPWRLRRGGRYPRLHKAWASTPRRVGIVATALLAVLLLGWQLTRRLPSTPLGAGQQPRSVSPAVAPGAAPPPVAAPTLSMAERELIIKHIPEPIAASCEHKDPAKRPFDPPPAPDETAAVDCAAPGGIVVSYSQGGPSSAKSLAHLFETTDPSGPREALRSPFTRFKEPCRGCISGTWARGVTLTAPLRWGPSPASTTATVTRQCYGPRPVSTNTGPPCPSSPQWPESTQRVTGTSLPPTPPSTISGRPRPSRTDRTRLWEPLIWTTSPPQRSPPVPLLISSGQHG